MIFGRLKKEGIDNKYKNLKINSKEKINLLDNLSNLLDSGIPVLNSFKIILYQTKNKKIIKLLEDITNKLNKGNTLSSTFSCYPKIFNIFDISIIEMGEITGGLAESINTIKNKEEKTSELKGKIVGALIYPMVIIALSIVMIGVFMVYVIPKIQVMYEDSKVNLPSLTANVIKVSDFVRENLTFIIFGIIIFILLVRIFKKWKVTKIYWDNMILRIPLFGDLIKKQILALFTSSLGMLLSSGIIITKSLDISSKALDNDYYEKELKQITQRVAKGIELSELMGIKEIQNRRENFLFPIELASVVKIGEETGNMPVLLSNMSVKLNKDLDRVIKNIQTAIEPTVIVLVGIIVGTLILAIMLPFFNMVNVI